jgi:hypothetical protein
MSQPQMLSNVKLIIPVVSLANVAGTISNLADIESTLRTKNLAIEIQVLPPATTNNPVDLSTVLSNQTKILGLLTDLTASLGILRKEVETTVMADLTQLQNDVAAETTVEQSAIALLGGLKAALDAAGTDPTKLAALSSTIESNTAALAAAVAANTPAAAAPNPPAGNAP